MSSRMTSFSSIGKVSFLRGIGNWLRDLELAYGMFTAEVVVVSVPFGYPVQNGEDRSAGERQERIYYASKGARLRQ